MNPADIPIRDLHLPAEPGFWPLAPGWWVVMAVLVLLLVTAIVALYRQQRRSRARRFALRCVDQAMVEFRTHGNAVMLSTALSDVLRRAMLAYSPRRDVAGLTGEAWADWLDRGLPQPLFSHGPGRALLSLPYRHPRSKAEDIDVDGLVRAVRLRLKTPPPVAA